LPYLDDARLTSAVVRVRAVASRPRRRHIAAAVGEVITATDPRWTTTSVAANDHDVAVAILEAPQAPLVVLRVACTATGAGALTRHRRALETLAGLDALEDWRVLVPAVLATGDHHGHPWLIEERLAGRDGRVLVDDRQLPALLDVASDAIATLHRGTATETRVDDAAFARWVVTPLEAIASLLPSRRGDLIDKSNLARLGDELHFELAGRTISTSFTHGDYWLGNLLVDRAGGPRVTGILDWDRAAQQDPSAVDTMHLVLSTRCLRRRQPIGAAVVDLLDHDAWEPWERRLLARTTGDSGIGSSRTLLLVTWLHHIYANLTKADQYKRARLWAALNVERVVMAL
jgi:aminoglycoside phosphotransferase (APT) family kinase protein